MSSDQAAMARQLEAMMSMFGTPGAQSSGGGAEMPDMSRLLAQMMGDPSLASGPNAQGQGMIGDVDDPAGLGGMGPGGIPPNLSDLFGGAGAGDPSFPGFGGAGTGQQQGKGKVEKYFPLAHFISVILLAVFAVTWWEPALRMTAAFRTENVWADRWAGFAGRVKGLGEVEVLPIFWAFVTVELILQTSRLMIFKVRFLVLWTYIRMPSDTFSPPVSSRAPFPSPELPPGPSPLYLSPTPYWLAISQPLVADVQGRLFTYIYGRHDSCGGGLVERLPCCLGKSRMYFWTHNCQLIQGQMDHAWKINILTKLCAGAN